MPTTDQRDHLDDLAGIDALDTPIQQPPAGRARHALSIVWPKLAAIAIFFGA
jgi:hypothetical protein